MKKRLAEFIAIFGVIPVLICSACWKEFGDNRFLYLQIIFFVIQIMCGVYKIVKGN